MGKKGKKLKKVMVNGGVNKNKTKGLEKDEIKWAYS